MKGLLSNTQIIWFKENYPIHGSKYCANHLKLTLKQTKDFAYRNKIHITKYIWDQKDLDMLNQMYPHWGLYWISQFTGVKRHILKSKVDTLKLKMLPKSERLCLRCKINYQSKRTYGVLCKNCYNKQKRD